MVKYLVYAKRNNESKYFKFSAKGITKNEAIQDIKALNEKNTGHEFKIVKQKVIRRQSTPFGLPKNMFRF